MVSPSSLNVAPGVMRRPAGPLVCACPTSGLLWTMTAAASTAAIATVAAIRMA